MKFAICISMALMPFHPYLAQEWKQIIQFNNGNVQSQPTDSLVKMLFQDGMVKWMTEDGTIIESDRNTIDSVLLMSYSTNHTCGAENVHNPDIPYGTLIDQEGNEYRTVVIGNQRWMAENLKTGIYRNGDTIAQLNQANWTTATQGGWMYYNDNPETNCPHGKYYNWYCIDDERNVCPVGWHVPTIDDYNILVKELDPDAASFGGNPFYYHTNILKPLVNTTGNLFAGNGYWLEENSHTNTTGLSILPSGIIENQSSYGQGEQAVFWLAYATPNFENPNILDGYYMYTSTFQGSDPTYPALEIDRFSTNGVGLNIRCIQDDVNGHIPGCTDPSACNYNVMAEVEDNSCKFIGSNCDDGHSYTYNDHYGDFCNCQGTTIYLSHSCGTPDFNTWDPDVNYGTLTDLEGNNYKTIQIGNQEWMAENLNTGIYQDGTFIDTILSNHPTDTYYTTGKWAYYNFDPTNECPKGKLYNWNAIDSPLGICPLGWHVPTLEDFDSLLHHADSHYDENFALYEGGIAARHLNMNGLYGTYTLYCITYSNSATNRTGFSAHQSGFYREYYNGFENSCSEFLCWSSTVSPVMLNNGITQGSYALRIGDEPYNDYYVSPMTTGAGVVTTSILDLLPVRCVRD